MNKAELNRQLQRAETSTMFLRAEIMALKKRLAAANGRLARERNPWWRRLRLRCAWLTQGRSK